MMELTRGELMIGRWTNRIVKLKEWMHPDPGPLSVRQITSSEDTVNILIEGLDAQGEHMKFCLDIDYEDFTLSQTGWQLNKRESEVVLAYFLDPCPGDFWQPEYDSEDWAPVPFEVVS